MGMTKTSGMLSLEEGKLLLEYQTNDAILGVLKSGIEVVEISLSALSSASVGQRLWSAKLVLQGKNMRVFSNVPSAKQGQWRAKLYRRSITTAKQLIEQINTFGQS